MFRTVLIAALAAAATPAFSAGFDLPPRKPGQWEMSIQVDTAAMPPQVIRMCLDADTDKMLNNKFGGMASQMCSRQEQKKDGDAIILESDCRVGDMTTTSRTIVTGDFNSAYTMKSDVQMGGSNATRGVQAAAPKGVTSQQTTISAKYAGECVGDMKPGDIDLGGGRIMNVRDMPDPQPMQ
ncbi:DUF3617 domain-containing protein [Chenggangzhangella methanolivorans]|uniref:DUF3617 family protein n=1 Tax=Chenggangzhangella methanolivorans TaxID=1437009 RepID=A0A9E6R7J1_9HYPH|nr:DUF3617 family protein [Chenggangzhangella methanolivorans]QZN98313.1 hypothetical protein K6K41_14375 [Chenggangzhangella methanolivorans]